MELTEKTLFSRTEFEGKIIKLTVDTVQLPNGEQAIREVVGHPGGVCVLALMDDGTVPMVRQFRYPMDRVMLELAQDAYSPIRQVTPVEESLSVMTLLEQKSQTLNAEATATADMSQAVDTVFYPKFPEYHPESGQMALRGRFQILGYGDEGSLQLAIPQWEDTLPMPADRDSRVQGIVTNTGLPQAMVLGQELTARGDLLLDTATFAHETIPMVSGLELGEPIEPDPDRPSLILRRPGGDSLWEIAKKTGSTMDKIRRANHLEAEPEDNVLLLIPVL